MVRTLIHLSSHLEIENLTIIIGDEIKDLALKSNQN